MWMQGERDSRDKRVEDYAVALKGLIQQLRDDLHRPDVNFVIGRISDYGTIEESYVGNNPSQVRSLCSKCWFGSERERAAGYDWCA